MVFAFLLLGAALAFAAAGFAPGPDDPIDPEDPPIDPENPPEEGTEGDDLMQGGGEDEALHGLGGNDTISSGGGDDTLLGGDGDDQLYGDGGNNILHGGNGNDVLESRLGNNTLFGDDGNDTLIASTSGTTIGDAGDGDDLLIWDEGEATLNGGAGDDIFRLNNVFSEGQRSGMLEGGEGDDTLEMWGTWYGTEISVSADNVGTISGPEGEVRFSGIERIVLGQGVTRFDASESDAGVWVEAAYEDESGSDTDLIGSRGDDTLVQAYGGGSITGGEGADTFVVNNSHTFDGNGMLVHPQATVITDFVPGEDRLDLTVSYPDSNYTDPDNPPIDPPEISIVEDPETGTSTIMVNDSPAVVLEGVSGLTLDDINLTLL
ncbi:calcium-binding protein [Pararhodobacter marinus]|uniref:calcium-binding protein n=1 Tax=Pararhodobacter marinus TaxID=2184063 RepID=UPI00351557F0